MCRRPTVAVPPTAGHTGPALQVFYRLRTPCQNPVIANQPAGWCGNPYSPCAAPSQHGETDSHVASLLGMTVTRKSSCPPWGGVTTPRRPITHGTSCDVSVGGGVPDAPPTTHRTPAKPCHCEERSDVAIRTPPAPHPIAFTSPFLPVPRKNIPIFPLDREKYLWYIHCTNTNNTLNTPKGGITRAAFGLSG